MAAVIAAALTVQIVLFMAQIAPCAICYFNQFHGSAQWSAPVAMMVSFDAVVLLPAFAVLSARGWLSVWAALGVGIVGGWLCWAMAWWGTEPVLHVLGLASRVKIGVFLLRIYEVNGVGGALAGWLVWRLGRRGKS